MHGNKRRPSPESVDPDRVRVAAERVIAQRLEREIPDARRSHIAQPREARRRYLLSHSLRLTETMAPEAFAAAREAARALGCDDEIELYHSRERHEGHTAHLVLHGDPIGIELIGDCLDVFDHTELVAVLGHEIGHCLAHASSAEFGWVREAADGASAQSKRIYAVASELTADRFSLLACRDLHAVLRIEMRGQIGRVPARLRLDTAAYLEQCKELSEDLLARGSIMFGATHPEHYVRGYAEWLFSETDVFAAIVGSGPGFRSIEEVDEVLAKLLGLGASSAPRRAEAERAPTDPHSEPARGSRSERPPSGPADIGAKLGAAAKAALGVVRGLSPSWSDQPTVVPEAASRADPDPSDLLDDDQRALLARFEELERREKETERKK